MKESKVKLVCKPSKDAKEMTCELEIKHATKLLSMKKNGGWELPKDSKFEMTKNGLQLKTNTGKN